MNKINILMVVITWVFSHVMIYNIHRYLAEFNADNIPVVVMLFLSAVYVHYRLSTHMISKVSTYL